MFPNHDTSKQHLILSYIYPTHLEKNVFSDVFFKENNNNKL